jgi:hypothetical protein
VLASSPIPQYSLKNFAMPKQVFLPPAIRFTAVAFFCLLIFGTGHQSTATPKPALSFPAYLQRGNQVQKNYQSYSKHLGDYYKSLANSLKTRAPDLLPLLDPPNSMERGYQILPVILSESPPQKHSPARATGYSWPWTDRLIDREARQLLRLAAALSGIQAMSATQSRVVLEKLVLDYRQRRERQSNIEFNTIVFGRPPSPPTGRVMTARRHSSTNCLGAGKLMTV